MTLDEDNYLVEIFSSYNAAATRARALPLGDLEREVRDYETYLATRRGPIRKVMDLFSDEGIAYEINRTVLAERR